MFSLLTFSSIFRNRWSWDWLEQLPRTKLTCDLQLFWTAAALWRHELMNHRRRSGKHKNFQKYVKRSIVELKRLQNVGNRLSLNCVIWCFCAFHYPNFSLHRFTFNRSPFSGRVFVVKHHLALLLFVLCFNVSDRFFFSNRGTVEVTRRILNKSSWFFCICVFVLFSWISLSSCSRKELKKNKKEEEFFFWDLLCEKIKFETIKRSRKILWKNEVIADVSGIFTTHDLCW